MVDAPPGLAFGRESRLLGVEVVVAEGRVGVLAAAVSAMMLRKSTLIISKVVIVWYG
jgi:hypothetical protein